MRKRLVDSYTDPATSIKYGLRGDPLDFLLSQQYTHDHVNSVARDFLVKSMAAVAVEGFDRTLAGGLSLSIAAGRAYDAAGVFYETITEPAGQPAVVTMEAADATNPRIDLVYVLLEPAVQALPIPRTFRRLLSEAEITAGQAPYLPENFTRFSEEHAQASVRIRKGTPAAVPVAPAVQAGEAPLFEVRVNAGAATLVAGNVTDRRNRVRSLAEAWVQIDSNSAALQSATFAEAVQDALTNFFPDASPFDWTLDDVGNRVALDIAVATSGLKGLMSAADKSKLDGVAAGATANATDAQLRDRATHTGAQAISTVTGLQAALDAKSAVGHIHSDATSGASGFMPAADKAKLDAATDAATGNALFRRDANGDGHLRRLTLTETSGGAKVSQLTLSNPGSGTATGSQIDFRMTNQLLARIAQDFDQQPLNIDEGWLRFYLSRSPGFALNEVFSLDYQTTALGKMFGNFEATGSISAGSKPFLIDHPLPDLAREKFLRYVAVESPRADVLLRGRAKLVRGRAVVDLDAEARQTGGTLVALARDVQAFVWNESKGQARWEPVAVEVQGGSLIIESRDPGASLDVGFLVLGERQDPYILNAEETDESGRWITEFAKPEIGAERRARLTAPLTEDVETDQEPRIEREEERVVTDLLNARGHLRHPEARGAKAATRKVRMIEVKRGAGGKAGKKNG